MSMGICLIFPSCLGMRKDHKKPPVSDARRDQWKDTMALLLPLPPLMNGLGNVMKYWEEQI
jgi:hypothetical protein